jgi:competence protein ComGC
MRRCKMTTEKIIQDIRQNKEMQNYTLLDMHLYLVIKQILVMYFNNQISKDQAKILKTKAVKEYENNKKQLEFEENMWKEYIENIKKTEDLKTKLRKQLSSDTETNEILNTCIELIQLYSKEEFI